MVTSKKTSRFIPNILLALPLLAFLLVHQSCILDTEDDELAQYAGSRPLGWMRVTQSLTPDIQWVGGRVAVIGVNKGDRPALDSTLVWLQTAPANSINSPVTVGESTDRDRILQYGGIPAEILDDDVQYTFWIAERELFESNLDPSLQNSFNFIDTTITTRLYVRGRTGGASVGGQPLSTISILRDERLLSDRYIVSWPEGTAFRRVAIRQASTGGFTDLVWHIVTHDSLSDNITSPFIIGETPAGTDEATAWPETGFEKNTVYIVWMVNSDWTPNNFSPSAPGYTWFRLFPITD